MILEMLCRRYKKSPDEMLDIKRASFELLISEEFVRILLKKGVLRSLKIKDIVKFIEKGDSYERKSA